MSFNLRGTLFVVSSVESWSTAVSGEFLKPEIRVPYFDPDR